MSHIFVRKILTMSRPATLDFLSKVKLYIHLLAFLYYAQEHTMTYDYYYLSSEFYAVKFKHKTTHCSSSPSGGLLQLMSAWQGNM